MILFITTRHSFIKQVARNHGGTRVLVTTQRVTVREDSGIELGYIKTDSPGPSPTTPVSTTCLTSFDPESYVSISKEDNDRHYDEFEDGMDRKQTGIHVTVVGK